MTMTSIADSVRGPPSASREQHSSCIIDTNTHSGPMTTIGNSSTTTETAVKRSKKPRHSRPQKRERKAHIQEQQEQQQQQQQTTKAQQQSSPRRQWKDRLTHCIRRAEKTRSLQLVDGNALWTVGDVDHEFQIITSSNMDLDRQPPPTIVKPAAPPIPTSTQPNNFPNNSITRISDSRTPTTMTTTVHVQPLLILDLNGILCHRSRLRRECPGVLLRPSLGHVAHTSIIPRPDWISWLSWLDQYFCLAIWTSAKAKTAHQLMKLLVPPELLQRFLFVWAQHDCIPRRSTPITPATTTTAATITKSPCHAGNDHHDNDDDNGGVIYEKHLSKVWQAFPLWNSHNTLLMDDSPDKSPLSQAMNVLHPPPMHGQAKQPPKANGSGGGYPTTSESWQSDEDNHRIQGHFFHLLIQYWCDHSHDQRICFQSHQPPKGQGWEDETKTMKQTHANLFSFLTETATDHMGWRGKSTTGTTAIKV